MTRKTLGFILIAALTASTVLTAQNVSSGSITQQQLADAPPAPATGAQPEAPTAPVLSDLVKERILNAAKDVEIGQLRLQLAQTALQQLVAAATPPGFVINERLELVPQPEAKTPGK